MRTAMLLIPILCISCTVEQTEIVTADSYSARTIIHVGTDGGDSTVLPGPKGKDGDVFAAHTASNRVGQTDALKTGVAEVSSVAKVWLIATAFVDAIKAAAGLQATTTSTNAAGSTIKTVGSPPAAVAPAGP